MLLALVGCNGRSAPIPLAGETMGTSWSVKLDRLPKGETTAGLQAEIVAALARFDRQMSTWRPDSELSRFNASRSTDWFDVSKDTAIVIDAAQRVSRDSGGAFDVTVLPLVNLWGFGTQRRAAGLPSEAEIAAAREHVGFETLDVRLDPPALRKRDPALSIDVAAIAPGYAADLIARLLEDRGVTGCMIEIGGEIRTVGAKADGLGWRIGIEKPLSDRRAVERIIELSGKSLATSGDYRHYFEEDGVRYSHTIDPRTGKPARHALASVTVVADDCMTADAYATTAMVLGPEEGYDWLTQREVPALLFVRRGTGFVERQTPAFQARGAAAAIPPEERQ